MLNSDSDCYKNLKKRCVIKLLIIMCMYQNLSAVAIKLKKCLVISTSPSVMQFVPGRSKTQES